MPFAIVSTILQILASSGLLGEVGAKVSGFASAILGRVDPTEESAKLLLKQVERMVAEKRGPTAAEWAEWDARLEAASERVQNS